VEEKGMEEKMEGWDERGRLNYKAEQLKLLWINGIIK